MRSRVVAIPPAMTVQKENNDPAFNMVLLFLFLDYGRPQSFFPIIAAFHPGWIIQGVLFFQIVSRGALNLYHIQTKYFILFLLLMMLHVPIAINTFWAFHTLRGVFLYFIVYLSIANFVNSYQKLERFINIWIAINFFGAVIGIKSGGKIPNSSFMGDENDFALVMAMAIPFAYFMLLKTNVFKKRILYFISICIFLSASVISLSRGGFIAIVAVSIYCWIKSPKKLISAILLILMAIILYFSAPATYWNEIKSIESENIQEGTGEQRWYTWKCAWRMFLDHPIIGVGQGNFSWNIQNYEPEGGLKGRLYSGRAAHSLYFTLIPELGIIGTILFLLMLYKSFINMHLFLKYEKPQKDTNCDLNKLKYIIFGVQGALMGYFTAGTFLSVLYYPHFWIFLGFSAAISDVGKKLSNGNH